VVATGQPSLIDLVAGSGIGTIAGADAPPTAQQMADAIVSARRNATAHVQRIADFLAQNTWQQEAARLSAAVGAIAG
jgi:hypothetical protein